MANPFARFLKKKGDVVTYKSTSDYSPEQIAAAQAIAKYKNKRYESYQKTYGNNLTQEQQEQIYQAEQREQTRKFQKKIESGKTASKEAAYISEKARYDKMSRPIKRVLGFIQSPTRAFYGNRLPPKSMQTVAGIKTGKRGRPRGTLDKRYAEYGGVWGFRREMRRRDRAERLQYMQNARAMSRGTFAGLGLRPPTPPNPNRARESATFPDTDGSVDMADFNNIVDEATSTYD